MVSLLALQEHGAEAAEHAADPGIMNAAWFIAVLPLVCFFLIVFVGKRLPFKGAEIGILGVGTGLLLSLLTLLRALDGATVKRTFEYFRIGDFHLEFGMSVDGLAAVMLVVVTLVSTCVHLYSYAYMHGDLRFTWFFAVLSLFTGSMLVLVLAPNLIQLLIGWELIGVCSYLLIGHWWEEKENSSAAMKAFITTRVGDVAMLFGFFVLIFATGTADIAEISELAEGVWKPRRGSSASPFPTR